MSDNKKNRFLQKLKNKYRLVILNDVTFEERIVIIITPLLILFISLVVSFFMIFSTFLLFSYTPLKEYVPGKTSLETQKELISISLQVDSLITLVEARDLYIKNLKIILNGGVPVEKEEGLDVEDTIKTEDLESSNNDSLFREKIEEKSSGDYINNSKNTSIHFFSPVSGEFTQEYSISKKHFGVDLVTKKDAIISSVADGKIVLSDWTRGGGFIISVQHANGFLSIYKHNSKLLKELGDFVSAGDPIAVVGSSGELTSGPHLHFELWKNGKSVNPIHYILF